jgi:hypothetical protein
MTLSPLASTLLSLAVIGVFALVGGGALVIRRGDRQRGILMIIAALVLLGNILILIL